MTWINQHIGWLASVIGVLTFLWAAFWKLTSWIGLVPRSRAEWYLLWLMSSFVLIFGFAGKQRKAVPAQDIDLSRYAA